MPERGKQQPRDADRKVERAIEVVALGESPDPETSEGQRKEELPDTRLARSHNDEWYFWSARSAIPNRWEQLFGSEGGQRLGNGAATPKVRVSQLTHRLDSFASLPSTNRRGEARSMHWTETAPYEPTDPA